MVEAACVPRGQRILGAIHDQKGANVTKCVGSVEIQCVCLHQ